MKLRFSPLTSIVGIILSSLLFLGVSNLAFSAAPPTAISYQGFLTSATGTPQTGTTTVTIRIYDASTGGTLLFEELHPTTGINNGYFTVQIGAVGDVNGTTAASSITDLTFDRSYYVTVELASPFSTGEMTLAGGTRSQLGTVPFATIAYGALQATSSTGLLTQKGRIYFNTNDNQLYVYDGSSWNALGVAGSGITSLNGLTGLVQTFALSTSGTDVAITSTGTTHTFSFPNAGASSRGLVSTTTQTFAGDKTFTGTTTLTRALITEATSTSFYSTLLSAATSFFTNITATDALFTRATSSTFVTSLFTGGAVTATTSLTVQGQTTLATASSTALTATTLYSTNAILTNATTTLLAAVNASTTNATTSRSYITTLVAASSTLTDALLTRSTTTDAYITRLVAASSTLTEAIITTLTATNASTTNVSVANNLYVTGQTTLGNASTTALSGTDLTFTNGFIQALTATNASTTALSGTGLTFTSGFIASLTASSLTTGTITATSSLTSEGTLTVLGQSSLSNASTSNLSTTNLTATGTLSVSGQTTLTTASATSLTVSGQSYFTTSSSTAGTITTLYSTNATLTNASSTGLTATQLYFGNASSTGGLTLASLFGANLTACNSSTEKLLWSGGTFTCGTDAGGAGGTITSLNGSSVASQTLATSTLSTVGLDLFITSSTTNGVHTFSLSPQAGYAIPLTASSSNWNSFFNSPVSYLIAGANILFSGTSTIALNPNLSITSLTTTGDVTVQGTSTLATTTISTLTVTTASTTALSGTDLTFTNGFIQALTATNASTTNLSGTGLTFTSGFIASLTASSLTTGTITATSSLTSEGTLTVLGQSSLSNASTSNLSTTNLVATGTLSVSGQTTLNTASATGITSTNIYGTNANITNATVTTFAATNSSTTNATSTNFFATLLSAVTAVITNLTATNATATNLVTTNSTSTNSFVSSFIATLANITDLVVGNSTTTNAVITNATATSLSTTNLTFVDATSSGSLFVQGKPGINPFSVASSTGSSLFAVLADGNVGIGTTTPGSLLTVGNNFSVDVSGNISTNGTFGTTWLGINSSGLYSVNPTGPRITSAGPSATVASIIPTRTGNGAFAGLGADIAGNVSIIAGTSTGGIEVLRISTTTSSFLVGNVGIGTTTPIALLSVASSTATGTSSLLSVGTTSEIFTVLANGNVGVGNSSPTTKLYVGGGVIGSYLQARIAHSDNTNLNSHAMLMIQSGGASGGDATILYGVNNVSTASWITGVDNSDSDTFKIAQSDSAGFSGSNEFLSITSTGNVGIGTTTPAEKLDIWGNLLVGTSSTPTFFANSGLVRVGIGTNTPTERLHVYGNTRLGGTVFVDGGSYIAADFIQQRSGSSNLTLRTESGTNKSIILSPDGTGNVGIGTTTPGSRLSVQGNAYIGGDIYATGTLGIVGQTTLATASATSLTVSGSTYFPGSGIWSSSGNVGIGTTSPTSLFTVGGATSNIANFAVDGNITDSSFIGVSGPGGRAWFGYNGTSSNAVVQGIAGKGLEFNVNSGVFGSGTAMMISTGGNVGIGTTTPGSLLSVQGNSYFGGNIYATGTLSIVGQTTLNTASATALSVSGDTFLSALNLSGSFRDSVNASGTLGQVLWSTGTSTQWIATSSLGISSSLTGGTNGYLARWTSPSTLSTGVLVDNGTVAGVNATSSSYTFNVQGSAGVNPLNIASSSGTSLFTVLSNGSVGIGSSTVSTSTKLALYGGALDIQGTSTTGTLGSEMISATADRDFSSDSGNWTGTNWAVGSGVATHTAGNNALTLSNSALTSAPVAGSYYQITFDISTTATGSPGVSITFGGTAATPRYGVNPDGAVTGQVVVVRAASTGALTITPNNTTWTGTIDNVSIKEITVASLAQVIRNSNGTAGIEIRAGGTGLNNTFVGKDAGLSNTTGNTNSFLGNQAGYSNTIGINNSFLGHQSGYSNTAGSYNSFSGYQSGYSNTTGGYNSFLGYQSGYSNTTGTDNSFMGFNTGRLNTTGIGNSFVGSYAGRYNTTGNYNSFVGIYAGANNTTGGNNSFVGMWTGLANTTGTANSYLGSNAGQWGTTGGFNSYLGNNAGFFNVTGSYNVLLGSSAGYSIGTSTGNILIGYRAGYGPGTQVTSSYNTLLGYLAGQILATSTGNILLGYQAGDTITTGSQNLILGYNIDAASTTGSYQLNIGNILFGQNIDGTGLTVSTGNLGVGTATPFAKFSIQAANGYTQPLFDIATTTSSSFATSSLFRVMPNGRVGIGSSTPSRSLTVSGDLALTGGFYDSTNASGTLGQLLWSTGTSTLWVATSSLGISSSLTGGTNGYLARWTSPSTLSTGLLVDNGTVAGVNATSSSYTFNVQGSAGVSPFNIASSSGTSLLSLTQTGSLLLATTTSTFDASKLVVQGTTTLVGTSVSPTALRVMGNIDNTATSTFQPRLATTTSILSSPMSIAVSGSLAFIAHLSPARLSVVDISNPRSPRVLSTLVLGSSPRHVSVLGKYVYVSVSGDDTLTIIDISNPSSPKVVATPSVGDQPYASHVVGRYAYVANTGDDNFSIVDISNPLSSFVVSTTTAGSNPASIFVLGKYAYIPNSTGYLSIVDISNPFSPSVTATTTIGSGALGVYVSGNYAYVVNAGSNSLSIIDVSNPASPSTVATPSTANGPINIYVSGRYAYVTHYGGGSGTTVSIFDVSVPSSPVLVASPTVGTAPYSVAVSGRYVYVVNYASSNMSVLELGGIESTSALIHSLEAGNLGVRNDMQIGGALSVNTGITTGVGGILSQGVSAFNVSTTTASLSTLSALSASLSDNSTNSILDVLSVSRGSSGTAASGIGSGILFSSENASGNTATTSRIASLLTTATNGSEVSALSFFTRTGGQSISERVRITGQGSLLVGTTTESATLFVQGTSTTNPFNVASSTGESLFVILQTGKIGVGTTTPTSKLTVAGDGTAGNQMRSEYANTNTTLTGAGTGLTLVNTDQTTNNFAGIDFRSQNTSGTEIIASKVVGVFGTRSSSQVEGMLAFMTRSSSGTLAERMRVDGTGRVGIGSSTPIASLSLTGTGGTNPFVIASSTGEVLFSILQNGSVGIGSTTVATSTKLALYGGALDIQGTSTTGILGSEMISATSDQDFSSANNWTYNTGWTRNASGYASTTATTTSTLTLSNSFLSSATVSGKIYQVTFTVNTQATGTLTLSIGSTSHVSNFGQYAGSPLSYSPVIVATGNGALTFTPSTTWLGTIDDVSVKEITPASTVLTLRSSNGSPDLEFRTGGAGSGNSFVGYRAGLSSVGSVYNTFFGYQAGLSNTTGGTANTFIGANAGFSASVSQDNTFIGSHAGYKTSSGQNTAIGTNALYSNVSGSSNVAVGYLSLFGNIVGQNNTAIGSYSLYSNIKGDYNIALGTNSLYSNISGNYNSAFGQSALYRNTSGSNNIAFGTTAGANNTTGSNNTSVGVESGGGTNNPNPISNTSSFGYQAGRLLATSTGNLLFGYRAGDAITTGSYNTLFGYDIDAASSTGSYQLNIGNILFGQNIDGTGLTVSTGNLGVGTATPFAKFSIQAANGYSGALFDIATTTSSSFATSSLFTVLPNGRVGIGSSTPSRALTVSGDMTLTGGFYDSTNASGALGQVLWSTGTSTLWVATSSLGISSSLSGGASGLVARWTGASTLSTGLFRDNGTVAGVNATSSSITFNLQGTASTDPFRIASSTGTALLTFNQRGSLLLATTSATFDHSKLVVQGTTTLVGTSVSPTALRVIGNIDNTATSSFQPRVASTTSTGSSPYSVYVSGRYAYVVNQGSDTLSVIDVSNPASPATVSTPSTGDGPYSVYVSGRYAYVANQLASTMSIIDVSNPASPVTVSSPSTGTNPSSVFVSGRYAYVANLTSSTLSIIDVSNPASPVTVSSPSTGTNPSSVFVSGRYAYVTNSGVSTMSIIDVSNPASPVTVSTPSTGTAPSSVFISGRYAYVTNGNAASLSIIDISNPASATTVSTPSTGNSPYSVFVSGRYAYVANGGASTLSIIDISNPAAPTAVASPSISSPYSVFVSGRYAYVTNSGVSTMTILDLGGIESTSALIHSLEAGNLSVRNDIQANGSIFANTSIGIGAGGLLSQGSGAFNISTTTASLSRIVALSSALSDNSTNSVLDVFSVGRGTSGTAASGIGSGVLFTSENASGNTATTSRIASILTTATNGSEVSALSFFTRTGGQSILERARITGQGSLLVGTTTESATLFVQGTSTRDPFTVASSTGVNLFTISSNGRVGIGTTTPGALLDVSSTNTSATTHGLRITSSAPSGQAVLGLVVAGVESARIRADSARNLVISGGSTSADIYYGFDVNPNAQRFYLNGIGEAMRLNSTGLGIGTTTPSAKLSVNTTTGAQTWVTLGGTAFADDFAIKSLAGTVNTGRRTWSLQAGGNEGAAFQSTTNFGNGGVAIYSNLNISQLVLDAGYQANTNIYSSGTAGQTDIVFKPSNNEAARVTGAGYFGIGTSTPSYKLDVSGTSNFTSDSGITISGSNYQDAFNLFRNVSDGVMHIKGNQTGGTSGFKFITPNASNALLITDGGGVSIGTSTNSSRLDVFQNTTTSDVDIFRIITDVGTAGDVQFRIDSDGDVFSDGGINMSTPADLAENYPSSDPTIIPGMVVSLATTTTTWSQEISNSSTTDYEIAEVKKAEKGEEPLGVISTRPGILLGGNTTNGIPVAFSGRVPVYVTGDVQVGDSLTISSSTPGYAMKQTSNGRSIGRAISSSTPNATSSLIMMVVENTTRTITLTGQSGLAFLESATSTLPTTTVREELSTLLSSGFSIVKEFVAVTVKGVVGYFDTLFARDIYTENICVKKSDGTNVCLDGDRIEEVLNATNMPLLGGSDVSGTTTEVTTPSQPPTDTSTSTDDGTTTPGTTQEETSTPEEGSTTEEIATESAETPTTEEQTSDENSTSPTEQEEAPPVTP